MSVTIDTEMLAAEEMGMQTVGQVLSHVQQGKRLVVNLLIDGRTPDMTQMRKLRGWNLHGRTLFIETVHPQEMAFEVLDNIGQQLDNAELFKSQAAELLQQNHVAKAMEKLGVCFSTWNCARESVFKVSQLLRIDLEQMTVEGRPLTAWLGEFAEQLRQIKEALTHRDYVSLGDTLLYETSETNHRWQQVLTALRGVASEMDC